MSGRCKYVVSGRIADPDRMGGSFLGSREFDTLEQAYRIAKRKNSVAKIRRKCAVYSYGRKGYRFTKLAECVRGTCSIAKAGLGRVRKRRKK